MPNFRTRIGIDRAYYHDNWEERQLAAILFHILNLPGRDNVERLLRFAHCNWPVTDLGIYLEFSCPRDLWDALGKAEGTNEIKRKLIVDTLQESSFTPGLADELSSLGIHEFNSKFLRRSNSNSARFDVVQSPANWQLPVILNEKNKWLDRKEDIVAICQLKWAFKVKPDIVLQPDRHRALCLELKLKSREGSYPATGSEKRLLRERGFFPELNPRGFPKPQRPFPISQTEIQQFLMEKLLGFDTRYLYISPKPKGAHQTNVSWDTLFKTLDKDGLPRFMEAAIQRACGDRGVKDKE